MSAWWIELLGLLTLPIWLSCVNCVASPSYSIMPMLDTQLSLLAIYGLAATVRYRDVVLALDA